jgi:hypothetical protein
MGVDTDPSRFDQPQRERDRLERAFNDLGLYLMRQLGERPSSRSV